MGERPTPSSPAVTRQMSAMPRESTGPEIVLRSELHRRGLRFRVNLRGVPGTPDIAFTRARLAVFVDGCFWHGCPDHGGIPKNNREWWLEKFRVNAERDRRKDRDLQIAGWTSIHIWEHERTADAADRVEEYWRSLTRRARS